MRRYVLCLALGCVPDGLEYAMSRFKFKMTSRTASASRLSALLLASAVMLGACAGTANFGISQESCFEKGGAEWHEHKGVNDSTCVYYNPDLP